MKKVISMALLCIPAWIPSWREQRPEFIWSFIAPWPVTDAVETC